MGRVIIAVAIAARSLALASCVRVNYEPSVRPTPVVPKAGKPERTPQVHRRRHHGYGGTVILGAY